MLISSVVLLLFPYHQINLPKHSPSISSDILLSSTPPPAPVQLAKQDSLPVEMHLEYTQSHTSASGTLDVTERCECDVFVHLCVEWEHPSSPLPIMHEYEWPLCGRMSLSVQVRLHPKSQIEIRYCIDSEMKLLQSSWVRVEVSNCSSHLHRHFQYPWVHWERSITTRWKSLHLMMCCAIAPTCV